MLDSQKRNSLEKAVKKNSITEEHRVLSQYLQLKLKQSFNKLVHAQEQTNLFRLQGEVQILSELLKVVTNDSVDVFKETD